MAAARTAAAVLKHDKVSRHKLCVQHFCVAYKECGTIGFTYLFVHDSRALVTWSSVSLTSITCYIALILPSINLVLFSTLKCNK